VEIDPLQKKLIIINLGTYLGIILYIDYIYKMLKRLFQKKLTDQNFFNDITSTKLLAEISKQTYLKNLKRITDEFFYEKTTILWVLDHPEEFNKALLKYLDDHQMKRASGSQFVTPLLYLVSRHIELQEENPKLKSTLTQIKYDLRAEDDKVEGDRSDKSAKIDLTFNDLVSLRDTLPVGPAKLLLGLYTYIPPVRSDYDRVRISPDPPAEGNYMVLGQSPKLILREFKTANKYDIIEIDLPNPLVDLIQQSLTSDPRDYLFVNRYGQPYLPNTFNKYSNRLLKQVTGNDAITLTSLRHLYLSNPELDIKSRTMGERKAIAKQMGHSVQRQNDYFWRE